MKDFNIDDILGKAKEMQDQFQKMQHAFALKEIHGMAGIDDTDQVVVKVTLDGGRNVKKLVIGNGVWKEPHDVLIELVIAAINNATEKLNEEMQKEVQKIYAAPKLPSNSEPEEE